VKVVSAKKIRALQCLSEGNEGLFGEVNDWRPGSCQFQKRPTIQSCSNHLQDQCRLASFDLRTQLRDGAFRDQPPRDPGDLGVQHKREFSAAFER
jgi:hypothetical protein